ncbi:MAG: SMR family transporter [Pseudomonadota bacterium]
MSLGWLFLVIAVAANIATNFSLRSAIRSVDVSSPVALIGGLLTSPAAWIGIASAGVLLASFMGAIRLLSLSTAYAVLTALAITGIAVIEALWLGEAHSLQKIAGLGVITFGVLLLATAA